MYSIGGILKGVALLTPSSKGRSLWLWHTKAYPNFCYSNSFLSIIIINFLQIFSWITTSLLAVIMVLVGWSLRSRVNLSMNQGSLIDQDSEEDKEKYEL